VDGPAQTHGDPGKAGGWLPLLDTEAVRDLSPGRLDGAQRAGFAGACLAKRPSGLRIIRI
jgi:hypothetical protein